MKVVLSIKPEFANKIFDGTKKYEIRVLPSSKIIQDQLYLNPNAMLVYRDLNMQPTQFPSSLATLAPFRSSISSC